MILAYDKIEINDKVLFGRVIAKPPTKTNAATLEEAYLLHIKEGECWAFSENEKLFLKKGQSVLLEGMYVNHLLPDQETRNFCALSVRFHPEILKEVYQNDLPKVYLQGKEERGTSMAKLEVSFLIEKYFEEINYYFDNKSLVGLDLLTLKIKEILVLLLQTENKAAVIQILQNLFSERLKSFRQTIESHIFSDLSLNELAHLTNMSISSFKRHFKKEFQTTPIEYIRSKRLERASGLLEISDLSISQIAVECGFKTTSHFSKRFKEKFNLSPSEARLSLREQ